MIVLASKRAKFLQELVRHTQGATSTPHPYYLANAAPLANAKGNESATIALLLVEPPLREELVRSVPGRRDELDVQWTQPYSNTSNDGIRCLTSF